MKPQASSPITYPTSGNFGLRHTAGTTLTRAGTDIILVAEILGHSVETARRYALPTHQDRQTAIERLTVDEKRARWHFVTPGPAPQLDARTFICTPVPEARPPSQLVVTAFVIRA